MLKTSWLFFNWPAPALYTYPWWVVGHWLPLKVCTFCTLLRLETLQTLDQSDKKTKRQNKTKLQKEKRQNYKKTKLKKDKMTKMQKKTKCNVSLKVICNMLQLATNSHFAFLLLPMMKVAQFATNVKCNHLSVGQNCNQWHHLAINICKTLPEAQQTQWQWQCVLPHLLK